MITELREGDKRKAEIEIKERKQREKQLKKQEKLKQMQG